MDYRLQHKFKLAKEFESQGKLLHSINIYNSIIDEYPDFYNAYLSLADLYERIGSLEAAKSIFENIIKLDEAENEFKFEYGKFLMRTSQLQNAIEVFKKISTEEEPLRFHLIGYLNLYLDNYDEAKVNLLNFVISDEAPELICEAYFFLAKAEYELKLYDNSLRYIKKAQIVLSDYWELYLLTAKIYFSQSMFNHAEKNILKAVQINPREILLYFWAGKIFFANSEWDKAVEYYTKFIKYNDKTDLEQFFDRANKLIKFGNLKEALITYQKAKILNSNIETATGEIEKSNSILNKKLH